MWSVWGAAAMHLGRMHIIFSCWVECSISILSRWRMMFFRSSRFLLTFLSNLPHPTFFFPFHCECGLVFFLLVLPMGVSCILRLSVLVSSSWRMDPLIFMKCPSLSLATFCVLEVYCIWWEWSYFNFLSLLCLWHMHSVRSPSDCFIFVLKCFSCTQYRVGCLFSFYPFQ